MNEPLVVNSVEPLCYRWGRWCWHKPIWEGLPLLAIAGVLAFVDLGYLLWHWGKKL